MATDDADHTHTRMPGRAVNPRLGGFTEAGLSTTDLDGWSAFLQQVGGYRELWVGESGPGLASLWGLPPNTRIRERLLVPGSGTTGAIRLFQCEIHEQQVIRKGAQAWDPGGLFDLDLRVADVRACVATLERRGWRGLGAPVDWPFGELQVREWLTRGPDAVVLALIQRLAPPLQKVAKLQGFGPVFNASQIVGDMERALDFYACLGFRQLLRHRGPLGGRGGEVLGLAPGEAPQTPVDLAILHPDGRLEGSVELLHVGGKTGRDFSQCARPFNLGLNLLRFPVRGLRDWADRLQRDGLDEACRAGTGPVALRLEPFGATEVLALRSPDGAWLEFYEDFPYGSDSM